MAFDQDTVIALQTRRAMHRQRFRHLIENDPHLNDCDDGELIERLYDGDALTCLALADAIECYPADQLAQAICLLVTIALDRGLAEGLQIVKSIVEEKTNDG